MILTAGYVKIHYARHVNHIQDLVTQMAALPTQRITRVILMTRDVNVTHHTTTRQIFRNATCVPSVATSAHALTSASPVQRAVSVLKVSLFVSPAMIDVPSAQEKPTTSVRFALKATPSFKELRSASPTVLPDS